jgi:hypothetical protein
MKNNNKELKDIVIDKVVEKTHEVFREVYEGLGITNGDISPEHHIALSYAQGEITKIISEVIEINMQDNKKALLEEKKKVINTLNNVMMDSVKDEETLTGKMLENIIQVAEELKREDF